MYVAFYMILVYLFVIGIWTALESREEKKLFTHPFCVTLQTQISKPNKQIRRWKNE